MRRIDLIVLSFYLFITGGAFPRNQSSVTGARSAGLGNASVVLSDLWSVINNQAGLAGMKTISGGLFVNNSYFLKELSLKSGVFCLPARPGVIGCGMTYLGYALYSEKKIVLSYARAFSEHFSAGVGLDYLSVTFGEGYGSSQILSCEAGLLARVGGQVSLGVHLVNPARVVIGKDSPDDLPVVMQVGCLWKITSFLRLVVETEKELNLSPSFSTGLEYDLVEKIQARAGFMTSPNLLESSPGPFTSSYSFGFGIQQARWDFDLAASVHQVLGWSPAISVAYRF
jgi:hypothetical protein